MYIIQRLINLKLNSSINSVDYILSDYFLNNFHSLEHKTIHQLVDLTNVSKPTIIRFYKDAGFTNYHTFINELIKEFEENDSYSFNQKKNKTVKINANLDISLFQSLINYLTMADSIFFYGSSSDMILFKSLIYLPPFHKKNIYFLEQWNQISIIEQLKAANSNNVLIIADSLYNYHSWSERVLFRDVPLKVDDLHQLSLHKFFIGKDSIKTDEVEIIGLPYGHNLVENQKILLALIEDIERNL